MTIPTFSLFFFFFLPFFLYPNPPYFTMIYRYFSFYFVYRHIGAPGSWWWSEILPGMTASLGRQRGLCKGRKGQDGLLADPQLSDTACTMLLRLRGQDACEGQARLDRAYVLFPLFPITGGRIPESSRPLYPISGLCRR